MSDNFKGSIAQKNVQFPIETVIEPLAGENYSRVMAFIPISQGSTYLAGIDGVESGKLYTLNADNYGNLTSGLLKTCLKPFFNSAPAGIMGVAVYDDGEDADLNKIENVYEKFKMYAYFKVGITESEAYNALQFKLSDLCKPDSLYSDLWIGTSDSNVLTKQSALITQLVTIKSNARVIYNPDTSINPALAQLGKTLSTANATGTPVGNSIDMVAFGTISPSGATSSDGVVQNLTATQTLALDEQKIGYNTSVGDETNNVVTEGSMTLQGELVGANWIKNFITYMCKVKTANLITRMNKFRNNATYQAILLILTEQIKGFLDVGRLANYRLTAPTFAELPKSGDTIIVANAWQAEYIDNTRAVTIYGTLYISQPTR